jgi:RNA-directed DNA polymerase
VAAEGFAVNAGKTRVLRAGRRQTVTGVVVNKVMGLSRHERRKLRAALHRQSMEAGRADIAEQLRLHGKLAYLFMLNRIQALALGWRQSAGRG